MPLKKEEEAIRIWLKTWKSTRSDVRRMTSASASSKGAGATEGGLRVGVVVACDIVHSIY